MVSCIPLCGTHCDLYQYFKPWDCIMVPCKIQDSNRTVISHSCATKWHVTLVAITGAIKQIPTQLVKSLQFIWRSGTRKFNLRVSNFQMICSELTRMVDYQNSSHTTMAVPAICVLVTWIDGWYDTISLWHCPNITRCYIQHTNGRQNVDHTLNLQKNKKQKNPQYLTCTEASFGMSLVTLFNSIGVSRNALKASSFNQYVDVYSVLFSSAIRR